MLREARQSAVIIYAISMSLVAHQQASASSIAPPYAKINWQRADKQLLDMTRVAQGRTYVPDSFIDLSAVYDDLIENLRLRYVLAYQSTTDASAETQRTVRVALVDPRTGGPLKIFDEGDHPIIAHIVVQDHSTPGVDSSVRADVSGTGSR